MTGDSDIPDPLFFSGIQPPIVGAVAEIGQRAKPFGPTTSRATAAP